MLCTNYALTCQYAITQCVWGQEHLLWFLEWFMCHTHPSAPDRQLDKGSQLPPESSASTHKN